MHVSTDLLSGFLPITITFHSFCPYKLCLLPKEKVPFPVLSYVSLLRTAAEPLYVHA